MNLLESILLEFGPCSTTELLDYLRSNVFYRRGNQSLQEWTRSKIKYHLDKICHNTKKIFKFKCTSGFDFRYGFTKFKYYTLEEPRFLKIKGYLKRCMFCGMPIYIEDTKVFHFNYKCKQCQPQNYFKLLKLDTFWAIISNNFVYGILDDLQSRVLRLPGKNQSKTNDNIFSELWLINEKARELGIIESDLLLPLRAEEYIA